MPGHGTHLLRLGVADMGRQHLGTQKPVFLQKRNGPQSIAFFALNILPVALGYVDVNIQPLFAGVLIQLPQQLQ